LWRRTTAYTLPRQAGYNSLSAVRGSFSISYRKDKLFIDVKNAPAVDVLTEIASKSKINLAIVDDVTLFIAKNIQIRDHHKTRATQPFCS